MNTSDKGELTSGELIASELPVVKTGPDSLPGFAMPEAVLHSIPLPPEFEQEVKSAARENKVASILPKFFNPLFRRQGVVNKHTIRALENVGTSLAQLANEIEGRDRVLEKLGDHLNLHVKHARQIYRALLQVSDHLDHRATDLQTKLEEETAVARVRTDSLIASIRSIDFQLGKFRTLAGDWGGRLDEQDNALKRQKESLAGGMEKLLEVRTKVAAGLAELGQRMDSESEFREELSQKIAAEGEARERARLNAQEDAAKLAEKIVTLEDRLTVELKGWLTSGVSAQTEESDARTEERIIALENRIAADYSRSIQTEAFAREELAQRLHAETATREHSLAHSRENEARLEQRIAELERRLAADFSQHTQSEAVALTQKILAEGEARGNLSFATKESETRTAERIAEFEHRIAQLEDSREAILASIRAVNSAQPEFSSDLNSLRSGCEAIEELAQVLSRRLDANNASLVSLDEVYRNLLPELRAQLELLNQGPNRRAKQAAVSRAKGTTTLLESAESDGFYVALEARFRGSRGMIQERQSEYLPLVEEARKRVGLFPPVTADTDQNHRLDSLRENACVLDLGCGRGEWLELLKEKQIPSLGVDRNRFFLRQCKQRGCEAIQADIEEFLRGAPSNSVAVVTCFHVIEHIPTPTFQAITREIFRILHRGGVLVFETPNPTNVLTSSLNFLLDPTHLRPVHPAFAQLVLETSGFSPVTIDPLHPYEPSRHVGDPADPVAQRFNEHFYGPQDYAVIGVKP